MSNSIILKQLVFKEKRKNKKSFKITSLDGLAFSVDIKKIACSGDNEDSRGFEFLSASCINTRIVRNNSASTKEDILFFCLPTQLFGFCFYSIYKHVFAFFCAKNAWYFATHFPSKPLPFF